MSDEQQKPPPDKAQEASPAPPRQHLPAPADGGDGWTSVALWWLLLGDKPDDARFIYGWAIPASAKRAARWTAPKPETRHAPGGREFRLLRMVLDAPESACSGLLRRVADGEALADACMAEALPPPPPAAPPDAFRRPARSKGRGGRRGTEPDLPERLPDRFLDTREREDDRRPILASPVSPNAEAPAEASSVVLGERLSDEWPGGRALGLAAADRVAIARATLEYLEGETGLAFRGRDAVRVGLLETLRFPSTRLDETPRVRMRPASDKVTVWLDPEEHVPGRRWLVRCRQRSPAGVVADECQIATAATGDGQELSVSFAVPAGGPFSSDVEVWSEQPDSSRWSIWFTHRYHPFRQFHGTFVALGTGVQAEAGWLSQYQRGRPGKQAAELRNVRRGDLEQRMAAGEVPEWWDASTAARATASRLFPPASRARFFPRGFDQQQEEQGELSFAKWFRDLTARRDVARLVIVDPYFDDHGVELLGLAAGTGIKYRVLRSTRCGFSGSGPSEPEVPADPGSGSGEAGPSVATATSGEPEHAQRIRDACAAQAHLLRGLDLTIDDLRPTRRQRQAFHDRYIVLFDADGRAVDGYHLSNSLQHAARNYPLLVTEIPLDVLEPLADYVNALCKADPSVVGGHSLVRLFPPSLPASAPEAPAGPSLIDRFRSFVRDLVPPDDETGQQRVADFAVIEKHGAELGRRLAAEPPDQFPTRWTEFAEWLANIPDVATWRRSVTLSGGASLAEQLERFLESAAVRRIPEGLLGHPVSRQEGGVLHACRAGFADCVHPAWDFLDRLVPWFGQPWSVRYAAQMLADLAPDRLVAAIDLVAREDQVPANGTDLRGAREALLDLLIVSLCGHLEATPATDDLESIVRQPTGLVRALAWAAFGRRFLAGEATADDLDHVAGILPDRDRVLALAECVWHLRLQANHADRVESADVSERRRSLFARIANAWPSDADEAFLRTVVRRCSGPLEGDWARNLHDELFSPLVADGKLPAEVVARTWSGIVCDRIEAIAGKKHQFFGPTDAGLTDAAAAAMADAPQEVAPVLRRLAPLVKKAKQRAARPFARSVNFEEWSKSVRALLWYDAFVKLSALYQRGPAPELDAEAADLDLDADDRRAWHAAGIPDPTGLDSVWKQVNDAYIKNARSAQSGEGGADA